MVAGVTGRNALDTRTPPGTSAGCNPSVPDGMRRHQGSIATRRPHCGSRRRCEPRGREGPRNRTPPRAATASAQRHSSRVRTHSGIVVASLGNMLALLCAAHQMDRCDPLERSGLVISDSSQLPLHVRHSSEAGASWVVRADASLCVTGDVAGEPGAEGSERLGFAAMMSATPTSPATTTAATKAPATTTDHWVVFELLMVRHATPSPRD